MSNAEISRRQFLSAALQHSAALTASSAALTLLAGCGKPEGVKSAADRLALNAVNDLTTGLPLLKLPPGFSYFTFAWAGTDLADGGKIPGAADGMGLVRYDGKRASFIRNQEIWDDRPAFAQLDLAYDAGAGGGTVAIEVDLAQRKMLSVRPNLTGTNANCSGGVTPWGSWLSGEEQVVATGEIINSFDGKPMTGFQQRHGFMFEASLDRRTTRYAPIEAMGQMRHEAAAIDGATGMVYLTEDNQPAAGFYRFVPNDPKALSAGGKLQMLAVESTQELRTGLRPGQKFKTRWVDIADPLKAHADDRRASDGCLQQGLNQGGARFTRLEGIYLRGSDVFFTATNGGDIEQGQVFVLRTAQNELELIYESQDKNVMNYPDAIEQGPLGGHVICQDGKEVFPQVLYYLSQRGSVSRIAQNNLGALDSELAAGSTSEWSGVHMSPDQNWLFANVYSPGFSVAITGPFKQWAEAASKA